MDFNLNVISEEEVVNRWNGYSEKHLLRGRLNVAVDLEHKTNLAKLFSLGPMVSQLKVDGGYENFDYFGEGNANFATCHDIYL